MPDKKGEKQDLTPHVTTQQNVRCSLFVQIAAKRTTQGQNLRSLHYRHTRRDKTRRTALQRAIPLPLVLHPRLYPCGAGDFLQALNRNATPPRPHALPGTRCKWAYHMQHESNFIYCSPCVRSPHNTHPPTRDIHGTTAHNFPRVLGSRYRGGQGIPQTPPLTV